MATTELHTERIQSLLFGSNVVSNEKATEQRLLEQELDLQLSLLKKNIKDSTRDVNLFPEIEDSMEELPHLKDGTLAQEVAEQKKLFFLEEAFLEENVLETVGFCAVLALLMFAPNII